MSDNTQVQGRTYYTEHDYDFTPSANAEGDMYRTEYEWEYGLLAATQVGDVTHDPVAKAAAMLPPPNPEPNPEPEPDPGS